VRACVGSRRGEEFTWERALAVVTEAVEGGDAGVPVVLAGHSLGGYLAMAWASERPRRLAGLALMGASAVPAGPGAALYRAIARVESRLGVDRMSQALDRQFDALLPDELAAVIKEAGYGFDGIPAAWAGVMGLCRPEMLAEVTAPVLLLNGKNDFQNPPGAPERLLELLGTPPEHKRLIMLDGGHVPNDRLGSIRNVLEWYDKYLGNTK